MPTTNTTAQSLARGTLSGDIWHQEVLSWKWSNICNYKKWD